MCQWVFIRHSHFLSQSHPNVLGGRCALALTTSPASYEQLPCLNTDMSVTALTAVYLSPENQRKATLLEPDLEGFFQGEMKIPAEVCNSCHYLISIGGDL